MATTSSLEALKAFSQKRSGSTRAGQGAKAVPEFQKIVDNPGIAPLAPYHALAPLYLARAHALAGDRDQARNWYERFFERWKDADPDVPILKDARAEYARLTAR